MTFDDWMLIKDKSYVPTDDSMPLRLLRECWFSRDAEIATLRADANEVQAARFVLREHNDLLVKNHKLREQVCLYEQALIASWPSGATGDAFELWNAARKLATTEQK